MTHTHFASEQTHNALLSLGYAFTHFASDFRDDGDPENGPCLTGYCAHDMYEGPTSRFVFDELHGEKCSFYEERDLEFERWMDELERLTRS